MSRNIRPGESSIARKLTAIIFSISLTVLLLTVLLLIIIEVVSFRRELASNLAATAAIIASNSRSAILYNDFHGAEEILASLAAEPNIRLAYIFDRHGRPMARYLPAMDAQKANEQIRRGQAEFASLSARGGQVRTLFADFHVSVALPVLSGEETIGTVFLRSDQQTLWNRLLWLCFGALLVLGGALLLAYLLSCQLQSRISGPISALVDKMRKVGAQSDFGVRAEQQGEDELNLLSIGFNDMLCALAERNDALARYREDLEALVAKRTADLQASHDQLRCTNEQLLAARIQAEAANQAKSRFLAHMSHEIRTPLSGILGMAEILQTTVLDRPQQEMVHTMQASGEALLTILNDILDLAKIEAGKLELSVAPFDLLAVTEEAVDLFAGQTQAKGVELLCEVDPLCRGPLQGDAGRLRQVLLNLLGNAVKFTPAGTVLLRVRMQEESAKTISIAFEVSDTGVGIPPEAQQQIFDYFHQEDQSTCRRFGGTGLGLSIVRNLLTLMNGEITLESTPGAGSRFSFALSFPRLASTDAAPETARKLRGRSLLLVAEHAMAREVLAGQLRGLGLQVTATASLAEASLVCAAPRSFAFVLLDAQLPVTGRDVLLSALRRKSMQPLAILLLGTPRDEDRHLPFLRKPVRLSTLAANLLQASPSASEPATPRKITAPKEERILLVEDNPTTRQVIQLTLQLEGYDVTLAENGREALALLAESVFDLVLTDIEMPVMDGLQMTRQLRANGSTIAILGLSAHASKEHAQRCLAAGMNDFLSKPYRKADLLQSMEKCLSMSTVEAV
jgi:signal transduction histidine kinase/CheY-like chemotaxis protein